MLRHNPIYPMFDQVFNAQQANTPEWSRTASMIQDTDATMTVRRLAYNESLLDMAMIPLRIFYEGQDDNPRYFDGKLNPLLLVFVLVGFFPLGMWAKQLRFEQLIWCGIAVLYILMALFTAPVRIRYLAPVLPAIVVLSLMGIYRIWNWIEQRMAGRAKCMSRVLLGGIVVVMLGYNGVYFVQRFHKVSPLGYLTGAISRDAYISARRPEYPLIKYVNERLGANAVVLGLFLGQRRYYFDRKVIFSEGVLMACLKENSSAGGALAKLREYGITHLMVRWDLFQSWAQFSLDDQEREQLQLFWKEHVYQLAAQNGYYLFRLQ